MSIKSKVPFIIFNFWATSYKIKKTESDMTHTQFMRPQIINIEFEKAKAQRKSGAYHFITPPGEKR